MSGSMIFGRYDGILGAKHRAAFPKKFRDILGDTLIVTKGLEKCLILTTEENWQKLLRDIENQPFTSSDRRELERFFFGNAQGVELDSLRRFVISDYLLEYAGIKKEIVYLGIDNRVEVWSKTEWEERQKNVSNHVTDIADKLGRESTSNE